MNKAAKIQGLLILLVIIVIAVLGIRHTAQEPKSETVEGYINPESERTLTWVEDEMFGWMPLKTVQVKLTTGEMVEAAIPNNHIPYYIEYKDCPESKGRRVFVYLTKCEGEFTITAGKVEE